MGKVLKGKARAERKKVEKVRIQVTLGKYMGERSMLNISLLARETGVTRRTISALITGEAKQISFDALYRLCYYFGCAPGDLLVLTKNGRS